MIEVGNRRRKDLGDIEALAESIKQYGLMQPIAIDKECRLIAGGRRLAACKLLGWDNIETNDYDALTDRELRLMELEENIQRKDLTAEERSRNLVEIVKVVTADLENEASDSSPDSGNESPTRKRGGQPKAAAQNKVAERTGIPQQTISDAQAHVATLDKYPFMKSWPQEKVLDAKKLINNLRAEDGDRVTALLNREGIIHENGLHILENLGARNPESRAAFYDRMEGGEATDWTSALSELANEPPSFDPAVPHIQNAIKSLRTAMEVTSSSGKDAIQKVCAELEKIEYEMVEEHRRHPVETV